MDKYYYKKRMKSENDKNKAGKTSQDMHKNYSVYLQCFSEMIILIILYPHPRSRMSYKSIYMKFDSKHNF